MRAELTIARRYLFDATLACVKAPSAAESLTEVPRLELFHERHPGEVCLVKLAPDNLSSSD
ncbi:MAG: hypothetical protein INR71_09555 [Terriglobus roseus]|nr:hypothetical protein [Terriglobus roseus]